MKKLHLIIVGIMSLGTLFFSCDKEEESAIAISSPDNPAATVSLPSKTNNFGLIMM